MTETNKYIQRLVRVISEKEKLIDQLKRKEKEKDRSLQLYEKNDSSIVELQLRQELKCMSEEIKELVQNMDKMQKKIVELTIGLQEEGHSNQQLSQIIIKNEERQKQLLAQICELRSIVQVKEKNTVALRKKSIEFQTTIQNMRKSLQENENQTKLIKGKVEIIYKSLRKDKYSNNIQNSANFSSVICQLSEIQEFVLGSQDDNILNQTIEGISIIMHSFEEKLENIHCLTERNYFNNYLVQNDLKQSTRSVPPFHDKPLYPEPQYHQDAICETIPI